MTIISSLALEIDNKIVQYVPNTLKIVDGRGEYTAFTESKGDGTVDVVFSENDETKLSKVSFELYTTKDNMDIKDTWKRTVTGVSIAVSDPISGQTRTYRSNIMVNDPEQMIASDGKMPIEFMGTPAV